MRWLALIPVLLAGCGRADLQLELRTLQGDDPFVSLTELAVVVFQGDEVVEELRQPFGDGTITLGPIERTGSVDIILAGYDATGVVIARGETRPELPDRGAACCVQVCFCTIASFDAGDCTCGSNACGNC